MTKKKLVYDGLMSLFLNERVREIHKFRGKIFPIRITVVVLFSGHGGNVTIMSVKKIIQQCVHSIRNACNYWYSCSHTCSQACTHTHKICSHKQMFSQHKSQNIFIKKPTQHDIVNKVGNGSLHVQGPEYELKFGRKK